ncbi:MAG: glycoside hydrolase family 16 protein [Bacillus subtilis]|nr:glycoside hydrolase family 16 protein [Bacillus subtilis]
MMPRNSSYGGWPKSGEIDIMEYVGYDKNMIHGAVHTERFNGTNNRGDSLRTLFDVENEFHTYSVIWEAGKIEWFVDDVSFAVVSYDPNLSRNSFLYPVNVDWPFDKPFYIILNLAIGGNWGGAQGIDTTIFPGGIRHRLCPRLSKRLRGQRHLGPQHSDQCPDHQQKRKHRVFDVDAIRRRSTNQTILDLRQRRLHKIHQRLGRATDQSSPRNR